MDSLGPRDELDTEAARELGAKRIAEFGGVYFEAIEGAPFEVQRLVLCFGLIPQPREDDEYGDWSVFTEPGNYMAFSTPWDGTCDT